MKAAAFLEASGIPAQAAAAELQRGPDHGGRYEELIEQEKQKR